MIESYYDVGRSHSCRRCPNQQFGNVVVSGISAANYAQVCRRVNAAQQDTGTNCQRVDISSHGRFYLVTYLRRVPRQWTDGDLQKQAHQLVARIRQGEDFRTCPAQRLPYYRMGSFPGLSRPESCLQSLWHHHLQQWPLSSVEGGHWHQARPGRSHTACDA